MDRSMRAAGATLALSALLALGGCAPAPPPVFPACRAAPGHEALAADATRRLTANAARYPAGIALRVECRVDAEAGTPMLRLRLVGDDGRAVWSGTFGIAPEDHAAAADALAAAMHTHAGRR